MEFIIISGLSGAGKSKVASFLEDIGFYVVDNMPAPLMPKFAELCMAGPGRYDRVALVTDIRGGQTFDGLFDALHELHRMGCAYKILFVEASVETIIKRYKETRRMHPLSSTSRSLDEAVRQERTVLAPVRQRAEYIIDTSALSTAKLRGEVLRLFGDGGSTPAMSVSVISFGFKYGIPIEADQGCPVTKFHIRNFGHIYHKLIHTNTPKNLCSFPMYQDFPFIGKSTRIPVSISYWNCGDFHFLLRYKGAAVTDRSPFFYFLYIDDMTYKLKCRFQFYCFFFYFF